MVGGGKGAWLSGWAREEGGRKGRVWKPGLGVPGGGT